MCCGTIKAKILNQKILNWNYTSFVFIAITKFTWIQTSFTDCHYLLQCIMCLFVRNQQKKNPLSKEESFHFMLPKKKGGGKVGAKSTSILKINIMEASSPSESESGTNVKEAEKQGTRASNLSAFDLWESTLNRLSEERSIFLQENICIR